MEPSTSLRKAIRSALTGVAIALLSVGPAFAESTDYTVSEGDTLNGIAGRLGVAARDLVKANELADAELLMPGQVLRVPLGDEARPAPSARSNRTEVFSAERPAPTAFVWPLHGVITTEFGEPGALWSRGWHPGIDIAAPIGSRIVATGPGVVIEAETSGYNSGYGSYVKVDHGGGVQTLYAHLARVQLEVGDVVDAGTAVGTVGMTGFTTGPHLHLEVRVGGDVKNPRRWLD